MQCAPAATAHGQAASARSHVNVRQTASTLLVLMPALGAAVTSLELAIDRGEGCIPHLSPNAAPKREPAWKISIGWTRVAWSSRLTREARESAYWLRSTPISR